MDDVTGQPESPHTTPSVEEIQETAARAGLVVDEADARALQPGAARMRAMAAEVRALLTPDVQPSGPAVTPWPPTPQR